MTTKNFTNCVAEWDDSTNSGGLHIATGDDQLFGSIDDLKSAILDTMDYGGYRPQDCSWFCGNEEELQWLAEAAGLEDWVAEQEQRLGMPGYSDGSVCYS